MRNHEKKPRRQGEGAPCPAFGKCGACQMLDVPYERQLAEKQRCVEKLFPAAAEAGCVRPILGMDDPFHYRNKVVSPYAPARKHRRGKGRAKDATKPGGKSSVLCGMYASGSHRIVETDQCLLENEAAKAATLAVRSLMEKWSIPPYDEDANTGFIRHVIARAGRTGELLVTVVTNGDAFPSSKSFCRELVRRVPQITTVVQNVNERATNVILGETERVLYGPGFILDDLCGLRFRISSGSFYQVNAVQAEALYDAAVALADAEAEDAVIDAYCGTGTIGLVAAKRGAGRVIGVEAVADAVADARQNARHNGVENAEFACADAGAFMSEMAAAGADEDHLVLMMDPPRSGATPEFLDAACRLSPARIVYISCDPKTQARDVELLMRGGYRIDAVQPVDMFPHTRHIENIVRLAR